MQPKAALPYNVEKKKIRRQLLRTKQKTFCPVVLRMAGRHWSSPVHKPQFFSCGSHKVFPPDGCFGLLKRAFKRHAISSLSELDSVVKGSACMNSSQLVGEEDGTS